MLLALVRALPVVSRWGVALTLVGLALDLAVHVAGGSAATGTFALVGHLVTLTGMVVSITGVMWMGIRGSTRAASERRS